MTRVTVPAPSYSVRKSSPRPAAGRKRTWLFDVDGVIADFCGGVDVVAIGAGGDASPWRHWQIEDNYPEHKDEILHAIRAPGFARGLAEMPGAVAAVRDVLSSRDRVVFVTAPMHGSPTWCHDRHEWLRDRFGDVEIIFAQKKDLIDGDIFIDDNADHVCQWWDRRPQKRAYIMRAPYNVAWHMAEHAVSSLTQAVTRALQ